MFMPPAVSGIGAVRPYARSSSRGGSAPSSPRRPISDDPAGISPYSHWKAWPSAHLHPNRSSHHVSPHVPTPATMACTIGPLDLSSCTATVLAHGPVLGPAPPHRHPSCPAAPQTGTSRTILHPGQCSTSPPPQPGAALRLIAPPLFGAALVHACLCTSLHRCIPRTAPLSMRSAAPCGSA